MGLDLAETPWFPRTTAPDAAVGIKAPPIHTKKAAPSLDVSLAFPHQAMSFSVLQKTSSPRAASPVNTWTFRQYVEGMRQRMQTRRLAARGFVTLNLPTL
jgi:hypothetical protein